MTEITHRGAPADSGVSPLLDALSPELRARVLAAGVTRRFARGAVLWRAGSEPSRGLFIVLEGRLRVVTSRHGRQHLVHGAGPGATMGEVPLLDGGPYPATAIAVEPTACLVLSPADALALVEGEPELAGMLLSRLATRVRTLVSRLGDQAFGTVRSRLAASLMGAATAGGLDVAHIDGPQQRWAEDLGTVREVLARELRRLRDEGLIESAGRRRYRIVRPDLLEAVALDRG